MLVLASLEACWMIFLNHSLSIASYEGVRVAINYDSTTADVENRCESLVEARDVSGWQLDIEPDNVALVPRGERITVTVSAPCDENTLIPPWFFGGKTLSATTVMVKE
jgi:hypothetical protein